MASRFGSLRMCSSWMGNSEDLMKICSEMRLHLAGWSTSAMQYQK